MGYLGLTLLLFAPQGAAGQTTGAVPVRPKTTVTANLSSTQFESPLPFDEAFIVKVKFPKEEADTITLEYGPLGWDNRRPVIHGPVTRLRFYSHFLHGNSDAFFHVQPLEPGEEYLFVFHLEKKGGTNPDSIIRILGEPKASIANHFDQDVGVIATDRAGYWAVASSIHMHAIPINKNLRLQDMPKEKQWLSRVSVFAGLAIAEIDSEAPVEKYFGVGSPIVGVAVRPLPFFSPLRVGGGLIAVRQEDANPLVDEKEMKIDRFLGATVDFDVRTILGPLLTLAGIK